LSKLEPTLFFGAFDKLKVLHLLDNEPLQLDLVTKLCETVAAGTNLKKLSLSATHLSQVNLHLLGRMATQMATQLEELHLSGTFSGGPMKDQIGTIVEAIATTKPQTIRKLKANCMMDFSSVDRWVLARRTTQVEDLELDLSSSGAGQMKAIFDAIALGPGRLRDFKVISAKLSPADADVLARAVNNLEYFDNTQGDCLSIHQIEAVLRKALEATSLKKLILPGDELFVNSDLLEEAKKIIDIDIDSGWCSDYSGNMDSESDSNSNYSGNMDSDSELL